MEKKKGTGTADVDIAALCGEAFEGEFLSKILASKK
jgi:hypothetical protein